MIHIKINDNNMYEYFEDLIYQDNKHLKEEWKKGNSYGEYGLMDYDVSTMLSSKELIYDKSDAEKQVCQLETMQRFLHEYVGIEGLEELLLNNYGTIENSIFFEHDNYGNPTHIREHAKHQMKNAYLGSILLLECGYLKDIAQNIIEAQSSVTRYILSQADKVIFEKNKQDKQDEIQMKTAIMEMLEEWSYKIFMISSMMHDIGYPLEFYLRSAQILTDYPPYLKILSPTYKAEFAEIKSHLMGSQLFKLIDNKAIHEKYQANNHGVLSAVSFLMHFYYGGKVHSLNSEERCIVEMAAIAIYRHTDKFQNGTRMVYLHDPISYMVRLCDDLQEWERFKLLINDKHNCLICNKCGKRIQTENREYSCPSCSQKYTKVTLIKNRKVNYICMCDELSIEKDDKKIKIIVQFDLMKQIEVLLDDYVAITKSEEDLKKVNELIKDQTLHPSIDLVYFVSNNPIKLIEKMINISGKNDEEIRKWIANQNKAKRDSLLVFYQDYLSKIDNNPFGGMLEKNGIKYEKKVHEYVKKYYGEIYSFYQMSVLLQTNSKQKR